jgi:hypothetical protein
MSHIEQPQNRSARNYAAIFLFVAVYLGVLAFVMAPKDMIAAQSPTAFVETD